MFSSDRHPSRRVVLAALALSMISTSAAISASAAGSRTTPSASPAASESETYYAELRRQIQRDGSHDRSLATLLATLTAELDRNRSAGQTAVLDFTSCPVTPPGGIPGVTNDGFYFLSEILPPAVGVDSPACGHFLRCFLGQMVAHQQNPLVNPPSPHSAATLIVDRQCVVRETLVLPNRFVLAGVGTEGRGVLVFDVPDNRPAIRFAPSNDADLRFVTIRDLNLVGTACCGQVGVDVSHSSLVYLDRIRLHGFAYGVVGDTSYSIHIRDSDIHDNGFNLILGEDSTAWRVRDTLLSQSGLIGAVFLPSARGHLFSGVRVESNPVTGIYQRGVMNVIEHGWFEGNGIGFGDHAIRVGPSGDQNRILGNLMSTEGVLDLGTATQLCFNVDSGAALNNCF